MPVCMPDLSQTIEGISNNMTQIGDLLASITGEPSPTSTTFPLPKRKADDDLRRPVGKVQKTGTQAANSSKPVTQPSKSPAPVSSTSKPKVVENGRPTIQNSATSTFKNGQPTPPPTSDPQKAPKKGSFAEIMARGKAAQSTLGQVGKIQHKKIEKMPSKREREAILAQKGKTIQRGLDSNSKFRGSAQAQIRDGKNGMKGSGKPGNGKASVEPEKKVKKAAMATTGYAGTARPRPGASRPASRPSGGASSSRDRDRFQYKGSSRRDAYASEEEDDDGIEEEEDYYSDESDMEAAAFEVDEEEEMAARIARKEDAEALAEENRLKREKLEKRRRLEAMAKKAPGQRY
jgi:protein SPT2